MLMLDAENEASIFDLECQFVRKAGPCTICILLLWASDDPALNLDRLQSDLPVKKNAADMGVVMLVQSGTQSAGGLQVVQQFLALQAGYARPFFEVKRALLNNPQAPECSNYPGPPFAHSRRHPTYTRRVHPRD
ncbi:hypothetical protein HRR83_001053 [Exophiala dermatitidis]|uniref:Uncharacterized protein n=1 Tax=Exophiala dermatitidis TaxID=5970 RepID=A0AAN6EZB3_EXODE|nr:hypothetical protein HRR74_001057 [Exophiala dermatitidis]KAJ4527190.1 hypothetical protein HRR73_001987 [Exophiala dermatitidis]KAJ4532913.1 hypothetical protein HRR76_007888 [Exophiala dermatitidis]KAJ4538818.1 hypothetical protein HRR77_006744 [Exophiala dermatitidis]KAJ4574058.1 hypothetical protein HRR79_003060 [Exophiala dermatitidis]